MDFLKEYLITDNKKLQKAFFKEVLKATLKELQNENLKEEAKDVIKNILATNQNVKFLKKELEDNKRELSLIRGR